ncbi:hypothetical protein Sste5346_008421 [Sporothrix stenoceras]|uniref:Uncharacterized protein n=1 Tax=Sporothrix stenoceras TaxID=5173 RepID=A0ABR3YQI0_9PEZI
MSHLNYYSYEGFGTGALESHAYNQAVRVGDNVYISGQGGWDPTTCVVHKDAVAQIDQAFANVDMVLKDAGCAGGWEQVFTVRSYHLNLNKDAQDAMVRNFRKWMPNHKALWTCVGVTRLGEDNMTVEIEVIANIPSGIRA